SRILLRAFEHTSAPDASVSAAIPILPQPIAEHDYFIRIGFIFFGQERAAERGLDAEYREEIGRHHIGVKPLWFAVAGQFETPLAERRHILEGLGLRLPVGVIRRRWRVLRKPRKRGVLPDHHQPVRLLIRQWSQ